MPMKVAAKSDKGMPATTLKTDSCEQSCSGVSTTRGANSLPLRRHPINNSLAQFLAPTKRSVSQFCLESIQSYKTTDDGNYYFIGRTCMNAKYSLRTQMVLAFGSVNALTILLITAVCVAVPIFAGNSLDRITYNNFDSLVRETEGTTARYIAETLSSQLIPSDLVQIIHGAVQDRFVGYPNYPGYNEDELVPFWDTQSQANKYPIVGEPLPMDWQVEPNVNYENQMEHVQRRWNWYDGQVIGTTSASFYMQGMCDPEVTDPTDSTYYANCTDNNNEVKTGGVVAPTPTNYQIHRKASDLTPILKALYEYHSGVKSMGVYFANGGAGAAVHFPHLVLDSNSHYESIGCDWLLETPNPYNPSQPIFADSALQEQVSYETICRPNGVRVSSRIYNPLERGWCRQQAINPHRVQIAGPYSDAFQEGMLMISLGKAIYDKLTSEFIGCISVDFVLNSFEESLAGSRLTPNAEVSVVRNDDRGTVVFSTAWNASGAKEMTTIDAIKSGVSNRVYKLLWSLVDYNNNSGATWNATHIRKTYEQFVYFDEENGCHVTAYPIPLPPETYDPHYVPDFFSIVAVPIAEAHKEVNAFRDEVNDSVDFLVMLALIVGLVALGTLATNIFLVSHLLTTPLQQMNDLANNIFNKSFGNSQNDKPMVKKASKDAKDHKDSERDENQELLKESKCTPKTEIHEVALQFKDLVSQFTSGAMARSIQAVGTELMNDFAMEKQFEELYRGRINEKGPKAGKGGFQYDFDFATSPHLRRLHFGALDKKEANNRSGRFSVLENSVDMDGSAQSKKKPLKASLFFWIVMLIVIPFLIISIGMSSVVVRRTLVEFTEIIEESKSSLIDYERKALQIYAKHRAQLASEYMQLPIRDLHILTRYTEWLLFGGVKRADSFTEMISNIEACKTFPEVEQCNKFIHGRICDCAWDDKRGTCNNFTTMDSRYLQVPFFVSQSQDTMPNGDRISTSYPEVATSANTTAWWDDVTLLPGSEEGASASGSGTTYARIRALSALPLWAILYNQNVKSRVHLASYIGFEADGTFMGYEGCAYPGHESRSHFRSSSANEELRPEICPVGKYGFDPRCRGWYHTAKMLYEKKGTDLYVTPPYDFAGEDFFGQTVTAPMTHPVTGEYLGQTLVDFFTTPLLDFFSQRQTLLHEGGFPFLIAASSKVDTDDTILGPGFSFENPQPITDVIFANDPNCREEQEGECESRKTFQDIVAKMKDGNKETADFTRTGEGDSLEHIFVAYAPVVAKSFSPVNSSDFARGVYESDNIIYSLALCETEEGLVEAINEMENELRRELMIVRIVLITMIILSASFVILISYGMTVSIIEPMFYLLELIGHINGLESYNTTPKIDVNRRGRSLEVVNVSKTMESLYRVVGNANKAYFGGNLEEAYDVLEGTLQLYRGLNNQKGIGIASNNLGVVMMTLYRAMEKAGESNICNFTKEQIVDLGTRYFHEAIQSGEKAYDAFYEAQGWSPSCLDFMQHLSNRYFNRAMFLLTVKENHEKQADIEELGLRDLHIARDMDIEIVDESTQAGWGSRAIDKQFEVRISRIRGHLYLMKMGYDLDEFDIHENIEEAFKTVKMELKRRQKDSILFQDMSIAGRMQQIETELMKYSMLKEDVITAARIAIRMLVEDQYTLVDAQLQAVEVLVSYVDSLPEGNENERLKADLLNYQKQLENQIEIESSRDERTRSERTLNTLETNSQCQPHISRSSFFKECQRGDVTLETF